MVVENEDLPMPKTANRTIRGHSDIDVIAIKGKELVHIECQTWWVPSITDEQREFRRLKDRFKYAPELIFEKYSFLDKDKITVKNNLVTQGKPEKSRGNGPWDRLQKFCDRNRIELVEINKIIEDLISELEEKDPSYQTIGKETGIARFLIHLIQNDFLK